MTWLKWIGIALCISQSAILSGLNLAFFTITKLELEIEVAKNNKDAQRVRSLRRDANFLLATILWANVAVNVLLALLSGSVLSGIAAFLFSTAVITILGEIVPQAYFSRHALRVASSFAPVLRLYQALMFPVAKPTALVLDRWLGPEAISYFRERDIRQLIRLHMASSKTEIQRVEGQGALNFLELDDVPLAAKGELIDPHSIVQLDFQEGRPIFPPIQPAVSDEFLQRIQFSGKKWIVLVDADDEPRLVIDSDEFIRDALFNPDCFNPLWHCHRPIIVRNGQTTMGEVIPFLQVKPAHSQDDVVDQDIILLWSDERRVITGSDVLGRLLRGIVQNPGGIPSSMPQRSPLPDDAGGIHDQETP
ncbi:MAG: DUF21 domain-containing protein [Chloroflexi bacterium]|nr:DUF21 domain-containing protein [Chloroflexota bacterium]